MQAARHQVTVFAACLNPAQATFKCAFGTMPECMDEEHADGEWRDDGAGSGEAGTSRAIAAWHLQALTLEAAAGQEGTAAGSDARTPHAEEQAAATGEVQPRAVAASE